MEFLQVFADWLVTRHPIVIMIFAASPFVALILAAIAYVKHQDWRTAREMLRDERVAWREDLRDFRRVMETEAAHLNNIALVLENIKARLP